jgi:hypothetical protein
MIMLIQNAKRHSEDPPDTNWTLPLQVDGPLIWERDHLYGWTAVQYLAQMCNPLLLVKFPSHIGHLGQTTKGHTWALHEVPTHISEFMLDEDREKGIIFHLFSTAIKLGWHDFMTQQTLSPSVHEHILKILGRKVIMSTKKQSHASLGPHNVYQERMCKVMKIRV